MEVLFPAPTQGLSPPAGMPYPFSNQENSSTVLRALPTAFRVTHEGGTTVTLIVQMKEQAQRVSDKP